MPEVEIYTQPWCSFCARAVGILQKKGVAFREIEAPNGTPERAEAIKRAGGKTTVPQTGHSTILRRTRAPGRQRQARHHAESGVTRLAASGTLACGVPNARADG
jgi:glutaredoxin